MLCYKPQFLIIFKFKFESLVWLCWEQQCTCPCLGSCSVYLLSDKSLGVSCKTLPSFARRVITSQGHSRRDDFVIATDVEGVVQRFNLLMLVCGFIRFRILLKMTSNSTLSVARLIRLGWAFLRWVAFFRTYSFLVTSTI